MGVGGFKGLRAQDLEFQDLGGVTTQAVEALLIFYVLGFHSPGSFRVLGGLRPSWHPRDVSYEKGIAGRLLARDFLLVSNLVHNLKPEALTPKS